MKAARYTLTGLAVVALALAIWANMAGNRLEQNILTIAAMWLIPIAVMTWDLGWGLAVAMLAGMGASLYYTSLYFAPTDDLACKINEAVDCSTGVQSAWSKLFGIPVALYGLGFYFAVGYAAVMRRLGRAKLGGFPRVLLTAAIGGIAYAAFLAVISVLYTGACTVCISMYGVNLMLLAAGILAIRKPDRLGPPTEPPTAPFWQTLLGLGGDRSVPVMFVAGMVVFVLSVAIFQQKTSEGETSPGQSQDPSVLATYYHLPSRGTVNLSGTEPQLGSSSAPYLIVEWADYACPWCAKAGAGAKELVKEDPSIQLRFKHYPLSSKCNEFVGSDMHPTACEASRATECARQQGRFWELNDLFFKNQSYQSSASWPSRSAWTSRPSRPAWPIPSPPSESRPTSPRPTRSTSAAHPPSSSGDCSASSGCRSAPAPRR
jgi:uncharacterized membrane protein